MRGIGALVILSVMLSPAHDIIAADGADMGIKFIQEVCGKHKGDVQKAYAESKKHFESLAFPDQLELWIELNKQLTQNKRDTFASVASQLSLDLFENKKNLTADNFLSILKTIPDKNVAPEYRIGLMGWLLVHEGGYIDTSYMGTNLYQEAHATFKKIARDNKEPVNLRIEAIRNLELLTHNQLVVALRKYPEGARRLKAREEIGLIVTEGSFGNKPDVALCIDRIGDITDAFGDILSEKDTSPKIKTELVRTLRKLKKLCVEKRGVIDRIVKNHEKGNQ